MPGHLPEAIDFMAKVNSSKANGVSIAFLSLSQWPAFVSLMNVNFASGFSEYSLR